MKPLLVWDFDGVLVDSLPQRAIVAYFTYQAYKRQITDNPSQIIPDSIRLEDSEIGEVEKIIREKRPFLVPQESGATNFLEQLILALEYSEEFQSVHEFLRLREEHNVHPVGEQYTPVFLEIERALSEKFKSEYLLLSPFYPSALGTFQKFRNAFDYYICSQAEYSRIVRVLNQEGVMFDNDKIYSIDRIGKTMIPEDKNLSKQEKLRLIISYSGATQDCVVFVDDEIEQVKAVNSEFPEAFTLLATWGYVPPKWERQLKGTTITPVRLSDFEQTLKNYLASRDL